MSDAYNNTFKTRLKSGEKQIGLWMSLANAYTAEVCATAGFDWLLIDGEHAPNEVPTILEQLQALAAYPSQAVVRPVSGDAALIKRLLDIGAQTLMVPMVETAQQAQDLVSAIHYPPNGIRGVGSAVARISRWGLRTDYLDRADDDICLLVQAESPKSLDNLEAICEVEGIDGVFIGPADLAASMGYRGNPAHPEVQAAIEDAMRRIIASGKAAGTLVADPTLARRYLDLGCTFVAVGLDVRLLAAATRALRAAFSGDGSSTAPLLEKGSIY
ncbi:MAG: 2,4-dihydroxyhept-2-ene,7-dioic acid aldolase [Herminiimonas sp.]|nr:2,4-dihydroxyhept-2-ene,7-dioic acid aldolase [Herminiimonas sp.]MDB5853703.1 2,4-dihydroxyhept-2-ene,7-dioic acid aldolase [Herminiimonas sp.]